MQIEILIILAPELIIWLPPATPRVVVKEMFVKGKLEIVCVFSR